MGDLDAGERPPLSRERIVAAAIAFVDRRGLTALTMRRLGTELGVEAMSLYRYVAPWLRPPLRSLAVVEDFLSTLVAR